MEAPMNARRFAMRMRLKMSASRSYIKEKRALGISSRYYFIDSLKYGGAVIVSYLICGTIGNFILSNVIIMNFIYMMAVVVVIPNTVFVLFFHRCPEFQFLADTARRIAGQRLRKG